MKRAEQGTGTMAKSPPPPKGEAEAHFSPLREREATINIIVAVAENGAIGKDNRLLWRIAEDMAYFKQITWGHTVVMGRKTFESIGRPLPHRTNIVLSRTMAPSEQVQVAPDLPTALSMRPAGDEVFVIGGGRVYREALPLAHRLYLTEVHAPYDGDTFFPAVDFREWRETSRQDFPRGERFADGFSFVVYERNKS